MLHEFVIPPRSNITSKTIRYPQYICLSLYSKDLTKATNLDGFAHIQEVEIPSICHKMLFPKVEVEHLKTFFTWDTGDRKEGGSTCTIWLCITWIFFYGWKKKKGTITWFPFKLCISHESKFLQCIKEYEIFSLRKVQWLYIYMIW